MGPHVALSINAAQVGPVAVHFFAETNFYWYLQNEDFAFGGVFGADSAQYSVEYDSFITQAFAGIKLVWR